MSRRRRYALLLVLLAAFAAAAVGVSAIFGSEAAQDGSQRSAPTRSDTHSTRESQKVSQSHPRTGRPSRHGAPMAPREAPPPDKLIARRQHALLEETAPVARRFVDAFSRYEIGRFGRPTRLALRRTTTQRFYAELSAQPPRLPANAEIERARLAARLHVVPASPRHTGRTEADVVGMLVRSGERTPIAMHLRRATEGWRVSGLGQ